MKTILNNKLWIIIAVAFVSGIFTSCKKNDDTPIVYGNSYLRVVNAVSTAGSLDLYQSDSKITTAPVAYGNASTGYYTVKGGPSILGFKDAATGTSVVAANVGIQEGVYFTLFCYKNRDGNAAITGLVDNPTTPATNKARVRFFNIGYALNNSINVTYSTTGTLIASNIIIGDTEYFDIDPNVNLGVTVIGSATTSIINGSNFVAGKIYTVWFDAASATAANYHIVQQN